MTSLYIKLLQLPEHYFGKYSAKGFPDYLINHLSYETIIDEIERAIVEGKLNRYSSESYITYCDSVSYVSDNTVQLARRILCDEFSGDNHYSAWNYLLHQEKAEIIIELIINGSINKGFAVYQLPTLSEYYNKDLTESALSLFHELNKVYLTEITEENVEGLYEKYRYLIRYDNMEDKSSKLKANLLDAIRCIFEYLFVNDADGCVDLYLDDMLEQKTNSYLEGSTYETLAARIKSFDYLHKLVRLLEMLCDGTFSDNRNVSNLYGDIRTAILNIGHEQPDETIEFISHYSDHSNMDFRRAVSLLYDNLYKDKYENQNKIYTITETRSIVFSSCVSTN